MPNAADTKPGDEPATPPTREELQDRVDEARHSINETVEQIKGTVEDRVDAVAGTVTGMLSMTEQFQQEPVAWSLGALSAGFAMGYSLGRAHHAKSKNGRPTALATFADDLASELAGFGGTLVPANLSAELKTAFGVDLSAALERIANVRTLPKRKRLALPAAKRARGRSKVRGKRAPTKRPRTRT